MLIRIDNFWEGGINYKSNYICDNKGGAFADDVGWEKKAKEN